MARTGGGAMTRRELFGALAAAAAIRSASAQDGAEIRYREYARCLPDYVERLAAEAYARRNARIAGVGTAEAVHDYQAWARRTFLEVTGVLPERTRLNLKTVGAFDRPRYRVEKLVYESRPGLFVTANLYLPSSGSPPFPGVLFQMGHTLNGKGGALYQRCCQGLVQLGYIVLAFDPMGQGERTNYPEAGGLADAFGIGGQRAYDSRPADAVDRRNRDGHATLGRDAEPGRAGFASTGGSAPACLDWAIRWRHAHHAVGRR